MIPSKSLTALLVLIIPFVGCEQILLESKLRQYAYPNTKKCLYINSDHMPYEVAQKCVLDACSHAKKAHNVSFSKEDCLNYLKTAFPKVIPGKTHYTKEEYPYE